MTGALWQAVTFSGGTGIQAYRHYPGVFDPWWLSMLPLPDPDRAPAGQPVSLLAGRRIERYPGSVTERGRHTVALEDIGSGEDDGSGGEDKWYKLAAAHLTRLSGSDPRVTCTGFWSRYGDESFTSHRDAWLGAWVQMAGAKRLLIGEGLLDGSGIPARSVTVSAGDIVLIPKHAAHRASTPEDPGHSVHLAFAIDRDKQGSGIRPPERKRA